MYIKYDSYALDENVSLLLATLNCIHLRLYMYTLIHTYTQKKQIAINQ